MASGGYVGRAALVTRGAVMPRATRYTPAGGHGVSVDVCEGETGACACASVMSRACAAATTNTIAPSTSPLITSPFRMTTMVSARPIRASSFVIGLANLSTQDLSCQRCASHSRAFSDGSESDRRLRRTAAMTGSTASGAPLAKGIAVAGPSARRFGRRSVSDDGRPNETVIVSGTKYGGSVLDLTKGIDWVTDESLR